MRRRLFLAGLAAAAAAPRLSFAATTAARLSYDPQGRPTAAVAINGQGPFQLVIDTAAGGTVLSAATIERLGLAPTGRARMQGASGAVDTSLYTLDSIALGEHVRTHLPATLMPADSASSQEHEGVLGMPMFSDARVTFDFAANSFSVDTGARPRLANATDVSFLHGVFALAPSNVGGVDAIALIDTGARRTIANPALRNALGFRENDPRLTPAEPIGGATAHRTPAQAASVDNIAIAGAHYGAFELAFADLPVFRPLHLSQTPALILGVDILRRARSLSLDYASNEMQLVA